jgi:sugar (pentulose or hexulose) kinase
MEIEQKTALQFLSIPIQGKVMAENLLSIDCGTQSIRALIFDPKGNLLAKSRVLIELYYSDAPGLAEQDTKVFWNALCQACQQIWKEGVVKKDSIAAVALTTQRSTIVNVDKDGNPLRPAIVWLDQRKASKLPPLNALWGSIFRLIGMQPTVNYIQRECEANWIVSEQPEIWDKTYKYLYLSGYLVYRLTGQFVDSVGSQVGYMPFDYKTQQWAGKSHWYWQALAIQREKLVDLVPVGQPLGSISALASRESGIPEGLPLIAAAADKACEVLGAGSLEPNVACLSYGTTATINTHARQICGNDPAHPALSGCRAALLQSGIADLPRLLDGQLVQAGIRFTRGISGTGTGARTGISVRRPGAQRPARFTGAGAAALLVARFALPRSGSARRCHRFQ